jgi:branched-chain amino acid aminotransferase
LFHGIGVLKFMVPEFFLKEKLEAEVFKLCQKNQCEPARVRISVSRGKEEELNYLIECSPLKYGEESLAIDIFPDARKSCDIFSNLKSSDRLPYIMAAKFGQEHQLDDCLVLNVHGRICDSTISNIFWIKDKEIFTPPLSEGCVVGVMRRWLSEKLQATSFRPQERICERKDLEQADEIFLTNVIRGIRTVKRFGSRKMSDDLTQQIKKLLPG